MSVQTTQTIQIPRMIARLTPSARQRHSRLKDLAYSANPIELCQGITSPEEIDRTNAGIKYKALLNTVIGHLYAPQNSSMHALAKRNYTEGVPKQEIFAACYMAWLGVRNARKPIIYSDDRTIEDKFVLRPAIAACVSGCYNDKIKDGDEVTLISHIGVDMTLPVIIETENSSMFYKMGRRLGEDFVIRMHHATLSKFLLTTTLERPQAGEIRRIREAYHIAELAPYIYGQPPEPGQPQVRPTRQHRHLRHGRRTHR